MSGRSRHGVKATRSAPAASGDRLLPKLRQTCWPCGSIILPTSGEGKSMPSATFRRAHCAASAPIFRATETSLACLLLDMKNVATTLRRKRRAMRPPERRSEEHTSELQSLRHLVCRLLLEKQNEPHPERQERQPTPAPRAGRRGTVARRGRRAERRHHERLRHAQERALSGQADDVDTDHCP